MLPMGYVKPTVGMFIIAKSERSVLYCKCIWKTEKL